MAKRTLRGYVLPGLGDARNWGIADIRKATGYSRLEPGTLNVSLVHRIRCAVTFNFKEN